MVGLVVNGAEVEIDAIGHADGPSVKRVPMVGPLVVGPSVVGPPVIGVPVVGPHVVGPSVVGPHVVGIPVVGPHVAGPSVVGPYVVVLSQMKGAAMSQGKSFHLPNSKSTDCPYIPPQSSSPKLFGSPICQLVKVGI